MYWLAIVQQANKGDKEAQEMLRQEDELRTQQDRLTVLQELKEMADNYEMTANAKTLYRK